MTKVYIVCIGDELTKGEIDNTNSGYIARELSDRGLVVRAILSLPDSRDDTFPIVQEILEKRGIFIFTGGLGATRDDITRKVISGVLQKPLIIDREKAQLLEQWYATKGRPFTRADMLQASYPEGGRLLENKIGLAFGFSISSDDRHIFSLPGVPNEMKHMFSEEVLPEINKLLPDGSSYRSETLLFANIPEYTLDHKMEHIISHFEHVHYGTRASNGLIRVRIETLGKELDPCIEECIEQLAEYFICRGNNTLESVVGELLMQEGLLLSVAESCTAGFLSKVITDVSGSSQYFKGGVVSYSNDVKMSILGVSPRTLEKYGAVSSQTALEMARGVKKYLVSDIAISITGIAGPEGGSEQKPIGTVYICLYRDEHTQQVQENHFKGDRASVRIRSVNSALFLLHHYLKGLR
jgi:nicotinamide-nucleotide amidase